MSNSQDIGLASISTIKGNLDRLFGTEIWYTWELETISDDLKLGFDELARDKILLLQVLGLRPNLVYDNATFFLHSVEVINNKVANFDYIPMPTSLELAYALVELKKTLGKSYHIPAPNSDLTDVVAYLLKGDGYSKAISPFEFVADSRLTKGQTNEDTSAKEQAIKTYIDYMENL